jgi:LacI family transcriptional regulator
MKATIKDISQDLGVSVNTVYKALNDKPKVSEETRKKVIDKAKELNYKPNKLAQGLARSVKRIGLILPKYPESFTRYIVKGIEEIENDLYDYNIHSIINQTSTNQETMEVSNELIEKNVDGIIILFSEMSLGIKSLLDEKSKCDLPVVGIVSERSCAGLHGCTDFKFIY